MEQTSDGLTFEKVRQQMKSHFARNIMKQSQDSKDNKILLAESNKKVKELENKLKKSKIGNSKSKQCKYFYKYSHMMDDCPYKKTMIKVYSNVITALFHGIQLINSIRRKRRKKKKWIQLKSKLKYWYL